MTDTTPKPPQFSDDGSLNTILNFYIKSQSDFAAKHDADCDDCEQARKIIANAVTELAQLRDRAAKTVDEAAIRSDERRLLMQALDTTATGDEMNNTGKWRVGLHCGLEDRNITNRYQACDYGFDAGADRALEWAKDIIATTRDQKGGG